jgi:hypothetical protein
LERFEDLIKRIVKNFNAAGTDYMLTGALAASYYGTPRTTIDVDIVVKVAKEKLQTHLVAPIKKVGIQVNEQNIKNALRSGFKIITLKDEKSLFTLDIILSDKKLEKKIGEILGLPTFFQTPEELILSKLRMIKVTAPTERALKDKDDIKAILKHTKVNIKMIEKRAQREGTLGEFRELTREIEK